MKFEITAESVLYLLFVFLPVPFLATYLHWSPVVIFASSCLQPLFLWPVSWAKPPNTWPTASGAGWGGLLNASFGNACELIIALSALRAGYVDMVRASITGSIIGNILLVLGLSMVAGGIKFQTQTFNRTAATTSATLLALAAISLCVPAVFHHAAHKGAHINELRLSVVISCVQFGVYLLSLFFSLKTHKQLYVCVVDTEKGRSNWHDRLDCSPQYHCACYLHYHSSRSFRVSHPCSRGSSTYVRYDAALHWYCSCCHRR